MKFTPFAVLLLTIAFLISCGGKSENNDGEAAKNKVKHYYLEEELTIGNAPREEYMLINPSIVRADDDGKIYVMDRKTCRLAIYDGNGKFLKELCQKGIGPHEIMRPIDMVVDKQKRIHILDYKNRKIVRFHFNGSAEDDLKLPLPRPKTLYFSKNENYFVIHYTRGENNTQTAYIVKYDFNGKILLQSQKQKITKYQTEKRETESGRIISVTFSTPFDPTGYFAYSTDGYIFYGYSDVYEIKKLDKFFQKIGNVHLEERFRMRILQSAKDKFLKEIKEIGDKKGVRYSKAINLPAYDQYFNALWTDGENRLLVKVPSYNEKTQFDVYSSQGNFLEKMIINKSTDGIQQELIFKKPHFNNHRVYSIVEDNNGLKLIKRYRLVSIRYE